MNMKNGNKIAIVTVTAIAAMFVSQARAQFRAGEDDGIAASPKVRQMLNERKAAAQARQSGSVTVASASYRAVGADGIAASPKVRQMLDQRKAGAGSVETGGLYAGYRATGADGVTASPKVRAQLDERGSQFQIAPVK
jgi:hypothetical protein